MTRISRQRHKHLVHAKSTASGRVPDWLGHGHIKLPHGQTLHRALRLLFDPEESIKWDVHQGCYVLPHPNYSGSGKGYLFFYPNGYWCAVEVKSEDVQ